VIVLCLALVALLVWQHLDYRRDRDTRAACDEDGDELPDDSEPMVMVVHSGACIGQCVCHGPEVDAATRGQA
jgi:hypothetical protein